MTTRSLVLAAALAFALAAPVLAAGNSHAARSEAGKHKGAPRSFDKQPPPGTWAKCAVSGDVFQVDKDTDFATHKGRVYAFCCPDCKPDFIKDPARYAGRRKG